MDNYSITMKKELALEYGPEGEWKNFYSVTGKLIETTVRYLSSAIAAIDAHRWYKVVLSKSEQTAVPRTVVTRERGVLWSHARGSIISKTFLRRYSLRVRPLLVHTQVDTIETFTRQRGLMCRSWRPVHTHTHTRSITERTVKREGGTFSEKRKKCAVSPRMMIRTTNDHFRIPTANRRAYYLKLYVYEKKKLGTGYSIFPLYIYIL